jgi:hypothetical protein
VHVIVYERREDEPKVLRTVVSRGGGVRVDYVVDNDNPSSRRHGVAIVFSCEHCDGGPELVIAQHKGETLIGWREE